jgi:hypothetical protein
MLSTFLGIDCPLLRSSRHLSCIRVLLKLLVRNFLQCHHTHQFVTDSCWVVIGTADDLTGQAVYAFVTLKPYESFINRTSSSLIYVLTLGNSNMTQITMQLSPKNSFFKSEKSSDPSQLPRKSILFLICPKHAQAK